jgi:hypothetical protein
MAAYLAAAADLLLQKRIRIIIRSGCSKSTKKFHT